MTTDDRQLLMRTHRGDEASARALWDRHAPRLVRFALTILRSLADADEVVQGVFIEVLRLPAAQVRAVSEPGAWLALLTRRQALNHIRSVRRRRRHEGSTRSMAQAPRVTASSTAVPISDQDLSAALDSLPRRLREVIVLKHVCGLTFDQLALALGVNRNTAASRHRAALGMLRRALGEPIAGSPLSPDRRSAPVGPSVNGLRPVAIEVPHERLR